MRIDIESFDTKTASDRLLDELADYYVAVEREEMPGDPPTPRAMKIADWRSYPPTEQTFRWTLCEDGEIVAVGVSIYDIEQNLENGFARIHVRPDRRGQGHARRLAIPILERLADAGRHRIDVWIKADTPGEGFAEKLGMRPVYFEKRSRLHIPELDRELMRSWIDRAAERASDYELIYMASPVPDAYLEPMCRLSEVMNTAPREDFEEEDEVMTPERWRQWEESLSAAGKQLHNMVARHRPTGALVGYTQIATQDLQPDLAWQEATGVEPDHRNRGLGRWLKAALILEILEEHPEVTRVDTFNAGSNEPMLNINIAMGFRPVHLSRTWQGELTTMREKLGA